MEFDLKIHIKTDGETLCLKFVVDEVPPVPLAQARLSSHREDHTKIQSHGETQKRKHDPNTDERNWKNKEIIANLSRASVDPTIRQTLWKGLKIRQRLVVVGFVSEWYFQCQTTRSSVFSTLAHSFFSLILDGPRGAHVWGQSSNAQKWMPIYKLKNHLRPLVHSSHPTRLPPSNFTFNVLSSVLSSM